MTDRGAPENAMPTPGIFPRRCSSAANGGVRRPVVRTLTKVRRATIAPMTPPQSPAPDHTSLPWCQRIAVPLRSVISPRSSPGCPPAPPPGWHVQRGCQFHMTTDNDALRAAGDVGFGGLLGCGFDALTWLGWRWRGEGKLLGLIGAASASAHWMT